MDEMSLLDKVLYISQVVMQLVLIASPVIALLLQKKKVDGETIALAVSGAVRVVAREIEKGKVTAGPEAKAMALNLAARALHKPTIKGRSLALAEGVLEGEVHRLKS